MHIPKKYLHDKFVLLLASSNIFLAFLCTILILLRGGLGQGVDGYIVQFRANLGLSAYQKGDFIHILSFILFVLVVVMLNILISIRVYPLRRALSLTLLSLGALVLLLAVIISNALLALY